MNSTNSKTLSLTQFNSEGGNTKTPSSRCRKWCITLNNYTNTEYNTILKFFNSKNSYSYIVGKEVGEQGTPHLQIYVESKSQIYFDTLKKLCNRFHIEKAKGNTKQNVVYCSKDNNYITNFNMSKYMDKREYVLDKEYSNVVWNTFQENIIEKLNNEPHKREINWYHDKNGNIGKSFLCKYIGLKYQNVVISEGKKADVFNQLLQLYESEEYDMTKPIICILDISRHNQDYINYGCLESIKNGMVYSGKYEGGKMFFTSPHIIVFSNEEPDYHKWSEDRYNVICLD